MLLAGAALAGRSTAATEPPTAAQDSGEPAGLPNPQGYVDGAAPDDNGPRAPGKTNLAFSYYMVSSPALQPRNTASDKSYTGAGCSYMTSGSATSLVAGTDIHIPDGSTIKYLRLYYNDTNASASVDAFLTRYAPGTATADLVSTGSTTAFNAGFGFVVSDEITETVNNASYAYTAYAWPDAASSTLQFCGLRVAYYAPYNAAVFLPTIVR